MYFKSNRTYSGEFESFGGDARQTAISGGPGTVFLYHLKHKHRSLLISNAGRSPLPANQQVVNDFTDPSLIPGRAWLLPSVGNHSLGGKQNYSFEEVQIYGGAHLMVLTTPQNSSASIFFQNMIGDRSGTIHVANNQTMDLLRKDIDLPFNVKVYRGGHLGLAPVTTIHGVSIQVEGVISHIRNLTLHHGGLLVLTENSRTGNEQNENDFKFDFINVQHQGELRMRSSPATSQGMNLTVKVLHIEGGGRVDASDLKVKATNVSINAGGNFTFNGNGFSSELAINKIHGGSINHGLGLGSSGGASGGGHGGTGGRGETSSLVGQPYGNMYEPIEFGSSGDGPVSKAGDQSFFFIFVYLIHT